MDSYIFVRKSFSEMEKIFKGNILFSTLIDDFAEVLLLRSATQMELIFFESIQDHQFSSEYKKIKLSFTIVNDQN
jgi:hypothetical protein